MEILQDFVAGLKTGDAQLYGGLTVLPIISESDQSLPFLTLEDALETQVLEITETNEAGSVPELLVRNTGDTDVILIEGEVLEGAKQNRMVNTTTIVPAKSDVILPVTCVERGRWNYKSRNFRSAGHVVFSKMRKASHDEVSMNLEAHNRADSNQGDVWGRIADKMERMNVRSETEAMSDMEPTTLKSVLAIEDRPLSEGIYHVPKQIGFIAFIGGGFAGGDLFGSEEICRKQLEKLAKGLLMDAVDPFEKFPRISEDEIFSGLAGAKPSEHSSVGRGRELRFENGKIRGALKIVDGRVAHATVFPR